MSITRRTALDSIDKLPESWRHFFTLVCKKKEKEKTDLHKYPRSTNDLLPCVAATLKPIRKSAKVQQSYFLALKSWNSLTIHRGSSRRRFKRICLANNEANGHVKGVVKKLSILGVSPTNVAIPWPFD